MLSAFINTCMYSFKGCTDNIIHPVECRPTIKTFCFDGFHDQADDNCIIIRNTPRTLLRPLGNHPMACLLASHGAAAFRAILDFLTINI